MNCTRFTAAGMSVYKTVFKHSLFKPFDNFQANLSLYNFFLPTAREGNVFTGVCQ